MAQFPESGGQPSSAIVFRLMDPVPLIDKPSFWIAFALAEIALPMVIPNKRGLGIGILSVAGVAFAIAIGWSPSNVRPPSLAIFIPVALAGSVIAALSFEWRSDAALKSKLVALSVALREFQVECEARLARASTTTAFADAKKWGTTEFFKRFGSPINQLKDSWSLVVPFGAEYSEMLLGTHLAKPSAEKLASAASNELSKASERLPNPKSWIKRKSLLRSLLLCIGLAVVLWIALFVAWKSVTKDQKHPTTANSTFKGEIIGVQVADTKDSVDLQGHRIYGTAIVLVVGIRNRGQPSALGKWNLTVLIEGTAYPCILGKTPDPFSLHTNQATIVYRGGGLDARTLDPIPQGKAVVGILSFAVLGLSENVVDHPATGLKLTFADASDNQYEISRTLGLQGSPVIVPGIDMDVLPKPEPQPTNGNTN